MSDLPPAYEVLEDTGSIAGVCPPGWGLKSFDDSVRHRVEAVRESLIRRDCEIQELLFQFGRQTYGPRMKKEIYESTESDFPPTEDILFARKYKSSPIVGELWSINTIYGLNMRFMDVALRKKDLTGNISIEEYLELNREFFEELGIEEGYFPGREARMIGVEHVLNVVINSVPEEHKEGVRVGTGMFLDVLNKG